MDRDSFRPGPLARVRLTPENELVFVRDLRHPPETVWAALTDPDRLAEWAPFLADRDLGRPGDAVLSAVDGDQSYPAPARVLRADRPHLLEYTWGDDLLRWELAANGDGTGGSRSVKGRQTTTEAPTTEAPTSSPSFTLRLETVSSGVDVRVLTTRPPARSRRRAPCGSARHRPWPGGP